MTDRERVVQQIRVEREKRRRSHGWCEWRPINEFQAIAYQSPADELFFGGRAGSGKSDLILGLAFKEHYDSIIFRREYPQLKGLIRRSREIVGSHGRYSSTEKLWKLPGDRLLEFGAVQYEDDWEKYQGRAHSFLGFDEITHFSENLYKRLIGWNRTTRQGERCRVVCTGNPPTTMEGQWVKRYWGPWLDPNHPLFEQVEPGDLVWYDVNGKCLGKSDRQPEELARSRSFIPGVMLKILEESGYKATLASLPEPLRSQLLHGDFSAEAETDAWQIVPKEWVNDAIARYRKREKPRTLFSIGVDPARGGGDRTCLALNWDNWLEFQVYPGSETKTGDSVAALLQPYAGKAPYLYIDTIGIGSSVVDACRDRSYLYIFPVNGSASARGYSQQFFSFANLRSWLYWNLREQLNPEKYPDLCLPDDSELIEEICTPRYRVLNGSVIAVEDKESIKKRLGRSPDKADALVYAIARLDGSGQGHTAIVI